MYSNNQGPSSSAASGSTLSLTLLGSLDPRITFTRADASTCATYFNSVGVLSLAAANVPRFDHDPVTLAPKGLLLEESRQNIFPLSTGITVYNTLVNITVGASAAIAPDGSSTVVTATRAAVVGDDRAQRNFTVANDSSTYTYSLFVLKGTSQVVGAEASFSGGTPVSNLFSFNRSTGAVISGTGTVENMGAFWRVKVSATNNTTGNTVFVCNFRPNTAGTGTADYWGAQAELGAFATSYIPTSGGAVTRAVDVATMTGTNFSGWFNATQGTFVTDVSDSAGATAAIFSANDGTANNRMDMRGVGAISYGSTLGVLQWTVGTPATSGKQALAYALNNIGAVLNGGTVATDTVATIPTVTQLQIGGLDGGVSYALNGHIRRITYYPTRLPDSQLQALTA